MSEPTLASGPAADANSGGQNTGSQENLATGASEANAGTGDTGNSNGFNPAWSSMLEKLPKEFHNSIAPDLKAWDQNFQTKTQEVQSRYEPYNFLVEGEISPEQVQTALQIMSVMEADPQGFHKNMGEFYKDQWGQGQQEVEESEPQFSLDGEGNEEFDITQHPKFQELMQNQDVLANYLASQIQDQRTAEAEKEIAAQETELKEKYGDWDEDFVYSYAIQNEVELEDAVKKFVQLRDGIKNQPRASDSAPSVFSPSGSVPSSQPAPGSLSSKDTRNLVAEILARSNQG